jgi:N-acyl-D-amino-acid deacylase
MTSDLLIKGGMLHDGTGAPGRPADLLVTGQRITQIGDTAKVAAARTIDASGQIVAPGFIDIHTHSDMSLLLDGRGQSKASQGVTTEVTGNCGFSPFPINPQHLQLHADLLAGIGDDPMEIGWTDLEGYRAVAQRQGIAVNIVPLVGHGALRIAAMGVAPRPADARELAHMQQMLEL